MTGTESSTAMTGDRKVEAAAHTPGPWHIEPPASIDSNGRKFYSAGDAFKIFPAEIAPSACTIASIFPHSPNHEANARLIAAAPDMLAALEPFADIDGEGDEDFPDETPVTIIFGRTS